MKNPEHGGKLVDLVGLGGVRAFDNEIVQMANTLEGNTGERFPGFFNVVGSDGYIHHTSRDGSHHASTPGLNSTANIEEF